MMKEFLQDESGAQSTEYALIAAVVSIVALGALFLMGNRLSTAFEIVATATSSTTP